MGSTKDLWSNRVSARATGEEKVWGGPMSFVDRKEGRKGEGWEGPISST